MEGEVNINSENSENNQAFQPAQTDEHDGIEENKGNADASSSARAGSFSPDQIGTLSAGVERTKADINVARTKLGLAPTDEDPPSVVSDREVLARLGEVGRESPSAAQIATEALRTLAEREAKAAVPLTPEQKEAAAQEALKLFDEALEEAKQLRIRDQEFVEETKLGVSGVDRNFRDLPFSQPGARQVHQLAENLDSGSRAEIGRIDAEAQDFGRGFGNSRLEMEERLRAALGTSDYDQARENLRGANSLFSGLDKDVQLSRTNMRDYRRHLRGVFEDNITQAGTSLHRLVDEDPRVDTRLLDEYRSRVNGNLGRLVEGSNTLFQRENSLVDNNSKRGERFRDLMTSLLPPLPES